MTDHQYESGATQPKVNQFGDRYIEAFVGDFFESTSSVAEYQRRYGKDIFQENTLYVITGSDSGLLPRYLINNGLPKGSRYLFVEPEQIRKQLEEEKLIPAQLSDRIIISTQENWPDKAREMDLANYAYSGMMSYVKSVTAQQGSHPEYPHMTLAVAQELSHIFWLFSSQFEEHVFIRTQLANLAESRIPAIQLRDSFKGKSAIVMAAGPSLDEMIPWIKAHRHEAVLIAVSRISNRLLQVDLEPDFVCSVDPQFVSFSVSKEMFKFSDKTVFVNGSNATPVLVGQWPHRLVFSGPRLPWYDADFNNIKVIAPSVTNNAILLALELGCSQIILTGVDLCYSADGYTHASGTKEHSAGPMHGRIDNSVETNNGKTAETNKGYYEAINTIERQAIEASEQGCRIINPAGGAARMDGIEHIQIEDISIPNKLEEPAWKTIADYLDEDTDKNRRNHYSLMLKRLDEAEKNLKKIKRLSDKALECNDKLLMHLDSPIYSKYKKRMDNVENILENRFYDMSSAIKRYGAVDFAQIITPDSGDEWTFDEVYNRTKFYYAAFINVSDILINLIDSSRKQIISRIEETKESPDFELIFNQWRQDMQFGRAAIWQSRHQSLYQALPQETKDTFIGLNEQFHTLLAANDATLTKNFQTHASGENIIAAIIDNARSVFEKGDKDVLERIKNGLGKRNEPLAKQAKLFVQGLLAELQKDFITAKQNYNEVDIATNRDLKQMSLERTLTFSMNQEDYATALSTLLDLTTYNISYKPFYARLLALTNNTNEAIEVYAKYMQEKPRDLTVMLALGLLLVDIGAIEAAKSAMEHIKNIDPNHPGVEQLSKAL